MDTDVEEIEDEVGPHRELLVNRIMMERKFDAEKMQAIFGLSRLHADRNVCSPIW